MLAAPRELVRARQAARTACTIAAAATNGEGIYEAANLNPGQYRVEVEHQGFKAFRRSPIEVRVMDVLAKIMERYK